MKKSPVVLVLAVIALALVAPANISKAGKPAPPPPPPPPPPNQNQQQNKPPTHTYTVIQSISASSITVKGKRTETYKITNLTEISFKGEPAKVTDLKPGMSVVVTIGMDSVDADRIAADDPPPKK